MLACLSKPQRTFSSWHTRPLSAEAATETCAAAFRRRCSITRMPGQLDPCGSPGVTSHSKAIHARRPKGHARLAVLLLAARPAEPRRLALRASLAPNERSTAISIQRRRSFKPYPQRGVDHSTAGNQPSAHAAWAVRHRQHSRCMLSRRRAQRSFSAILQTGRLRPFSCQGPSPRRGLRGDRSTGWPKGRGSATDTHKRAHSGPSSRACQCEPHFAILTTSLLVHMLAWSIYLPLFEFLHLSPGMILNDHLTLLGRGTPAIHGSADKHRSRIKGRPTYALPRSPSCAKKSVVQWRAHTREPPPASPGRGRFGKQGVSPPDRAPRPAPTRRAHAPSTHW